MFRKKIYLLVCITCTVVLIIYYFVLLLSNEASTKINLIKTSEAVRNKLEDYDLWLIFTKVIDKAPLIYSFQKLINNIVNVSSVPISFHIIADEESKKIAENFFNKLNQSFRYTFYNVNSCAETIQDVVKVMTPHFSSKPGTYYSDALFYLSLGLYRFAPKEQKRAIMIDCDTYFKGDVLKLFEQFETFNDNHVFGLSPELSPVYRHILYEYKLKINTSFGEYYREHDVFKEVHPKGFQGYNSGVILFNLTSMRNSEDYQKCLEEDYIKKLVKKYNFRGHLGDQDFYTLLGYEQPHLIKTLNCGFNRQLCTWWRDRGGYKNIFNNYFKCKHKTVVLHGNCNTRIDDMYF